MSVRHCGDSFEALVAQARLRNLGISAGIFLPLLGSLAALLRFTRQAKKLAGMQMSFAAGVSHELRTPLTVISTAAYNLQGRIGNNPARSNAMELSSNSRKSSSLTVYSRDCR
jgi:signal transduction histidine kinase